MSSRHHYIPTSFQAHFTNDKGQLYRYDKIRDEFSSRWWYPKQLFFERNRNNVRMGVIPESLPEAVYQQLDTHHAEIINALATEPVTQSLITQDRILGALVFVASLWVRSPRRDEHFARAAKSRLQYALTQEPDIANDPERAVGIMDGIQVERAFLPAGAFLNHIKTGQAFEQPAYSHVGQMDVPFIVLTDSPLCTVINLGQTWMSSRISAFHFPQGDCTGQYPKTQHGAEAPRHTRRCTTS